jgi:4,5-dihydroxyphthalate decarboxylase
VEKLKLILGCWQYDRTRALADGSVQPDGIELAARRRSARSWNGR